jgi:sarcosine oxidase subunit gamma
MADTPTLAPAHPLEAWRDAFAALADDLAAGTDLTIGLEPLTAALDVRVDATGLDAVAALVGGPLPTTPNTWTPIRDGRAAWLGPDEWLLFGATPAEDAVGEVAAPHRGAAVDVSAQRTAIRLRGRDARELLSFGCALDLRPASFPPGSCAQTLLGQAGVLLLADPDDAYLVVVRSSFAGYVAGWLLDAAQEFRSDQEGDET